MEQPKPIAVIDTNVMLNMATCIDAASHYTKISEVDPSDGAQADTKKSAFIRMRVREATILSQHLHETSAPTFFLHEVVRKIRELVKIDFSMIESHFSLVWLDYICVFRRDPISVPTAFDRGSESIRSAFRRIRSSIPLIRSPIPVIRSGSAERLKHETGMVAAHEATVHAQDSRGSSSSLRVWLPAPSDRGFVQRFAGHG